MNNLPTVQTGTYRHNKSGKLYEVIGIALHTETDQELVVYKPLYESEHQLFARPVAMFNETVELDGRQQLRFEKLD